jgi:ribonuclease P protein component
VDQRFRWDEKLHRKSDFKRVFEEGRRYGVPGLTMWVYVHPNEEPRPKARLGLAISKAYGIAVARNRIKRLLREIFRLNKSKLDAGTDIVFSARPQSAKPQYKTLEPLVLKLWTQAKLLPPSPKP